MVLNSSVEPVGSRADGRLAVVPPVSGNSPARPKPGAGRSLNGAAQGWQHAIPRSGRDTGADGELIAARGGVLSGLLGAAPDALQASLRMVGAVAEDLVGTVDRGGAVDPLDERDPEYIRESLPALRLLSSVYFRADV